MITINMPNDTNPFLENNEIDMMVHLNDIRIDIDEECCTDVPLLGTRVSASTSSRGIQSLFGLSAPKSVVNDEDQSEELTKHEIELDDEYAWNRNENSTNEQEEGQDEITNHIATAISTEDALGVEEALLALDFAISGADGESDNEDDSESESDVTTEPFEDILPKTHHDYTSSNKDEAIVEITKDVFDPEFLHDVNKTAQHMVEDLLEESLRRVYEHLEVEKPTKTVNAVECNETIVMNNTSLSDLPLMDLSNLTSEHDDSADSQTDFNFDHLAIEASTPFVQKKKIEQVDSTFTSYEQTTRPKRALQNLFGIDTQPKAEEELNQTWCSPIETNTMFDATKTIVVEPISVANGTFTATTQHDQTFNAAKPNDITFVATDQTFIAATDKTFTATDQTFVAPTTTTTTTDQTFTESPKKTHSTLPEIRIITDSDAASVDLTTATPVNTPIELNYTVDGWDTFISNSMKKPLQQVHHDGEDQTPSTSLKPEAYNPMFVTTTDATPGPSGDATFAMDDYSANGWSNDDDGMLLDDAEDDQCEDVALLSLTFDSLRKQLTEALPHAQGSMSCSGGPADLPDELGEVVDELMNNDCDLENR